MTSDSSDVQIVRVADNEDMDNYRPREIKGLLVHDYSKTFNLTESPHYERPSLMNDFEGFHREKIFTCIEQELSDLSSEDGVIGDAYVG